MGNANEKVSPEGVSPERESEPGGGEPGIRKFSDEREDEDHLHSGTRAT